jgi:hypothetical protein
LIARLIDPNTDLNPEPLDYNYGPTGRVKELTPSEKHDYLLKLIDAFQQVKGLPPRPQKVMPADEAEGVNSTSRDQDIATTTKLLPRRESLGLYAQGTTGKSSFQKRCSAARGRDLNVCRDQQLPSSWKDSTFQLIVL